MINEKLQEWRRDLLELSLRNSLLKLRELRARGLKIVVSNPAELFQKLVEEGKAYKFGSASKISGLFIETNTLESPTKGQPQPRNVFATNYPEKELEKRLLNTHKEAKTFLEERGVNVLYLALGALKWHESDDSETEIFAPLLLIPVQLEKTVVRGETSIQLVFNDESVEGNYTLEQKMKADFGLQLPSWDAESSDVPSFFEQVAEAVSTKKRWAVLPNEGSVNLFSFTKLMMYHDLSDEKWPEMEKPSGSSLIKNLLQNDGDLSTLEDFPNGSDGGFDMDSLSVEELDHVLEADSTQAEAIERVFNSRHLVIKGPPGTGKSQTIVNLIAACLKRGKSVLFVSEKLAALEVVKKRLEKVGLGAACLELHSHKANRRAVLESLNQTLNLRANQTVRDNGESERLADSREQLNNHRAALLKPVGRSGYTPFELMGHILKVKSEFPTAQFYKIGMQDWTRSEWRTRQDAVAVACQFVEKNGQPSRSPFWGTGRLQVGLIEQQELQKQTRALYSAASDAQRCGDLLAQKLQLPSPISRESIKRLIETAGFLLKKPDLTGLLHGSSDWINDVTRLEKLFANGQVFFHLHTQYREKLQAHAHRQNFNNTKKAYELHHRKWFRFLVPEFKKAKKHLYSVTITQPASEAEAFEWVSVLTQMAKIVEEVKSLNPLAKRLFSDGSYWDFDGDPSWLGREKGCSFLGNLHQSIRARKVDPAILERLDIPLTGLWTEHQEAARAIMDFEEKLNDWIAAIELRKAAVPVFFDENASFAELTERLSRMLGAFDELSTYCDWNAIKGNLKQLDCSEIVGFLRGEQINTAQINAEWWLSAMTGLLDLALQTRPILRTSNQEEQARVFRESDRFLVEKLNPKKIELAHFSNVPSRNNPGIPMSIIRAEIEKQRRHRPLRKLLDEAGEMIVRIKPVFMMSPLSVAQYLAPGKLRFDFVVFDEASQVKPVEALGALLRGTNSIVVGDEKQLPPSNFFNKIYEDEEQDEEFASDSDDMQSILDLYTAKNARQTMLGWHYRSQHESLIAVSNKEFYGSQLVTLPSAYLKNESLGLQFRHFPETVYAAQKNEKEAARIIEAVCKHVRDFADPSQCSLGIVAFSSSQSRCIEDILMKTRRTDTVLDEWLNRAEKTHEPFFIKNLENVQGDERDVIFVSICYGRNSDGRIFKRFGPVNQNGGERRLNVLFTRAKQRCVLFSNFTASDLALLPTDPNGLRVFKSFLEFAETGRLHASEQTGNETMSPFEDAVIDALKSAGCEVHQQIGSAGYFVDLAIPHPFQPGRYLLGIECDGASFHGSRSARERDRLRQTILENLGWTVYRIWSTDWFKHPARELQKLLDEIARLKAGIKAEAITSFSAPPDLTVLPEVSKKRAEVYQQAKIDKKLIPYEFHLISDSVLIRVITSILEVESPIHSDNLKTIIVQAAGISRIGSRIDERFEQVFRIAERQNDWVKRGQFLWSKNQTGVSNIRSRTDLPEKLQNLEWISPEEIQLAMQTIINESLFIEPEELLRETLKTLNGGQRLTDNIRSILENELNVLVKKNIIKKVDNRIGLSS